MAIIQSDNAGIEKHLIQLESLVEEGGGGLHSDLVIHSEGGNLSVRTKEPMSAGREVIRLTRRVLLPEDQYNIGVKGDEFTLDFPESSVLTDLQKRLTECMVSLYNETDKVKLHKEYSFLLSLADYPSLLDVLEEGRVFPKHLKEWRDRLVAGLNDEETGQFIAQTFLKTRHLGYNDHIRISNVSILMPIVDFLNHQWAGSGFNIVQGVRKGDLTVGSSQPVEGSTECYAFYGTMDAFDSLVRYDFMDSSAPLVRSIAMEFEIPDVGVISIGGPTGGMNQKKLTKAMADLRRFMPNITLHEEKDAPRRLNVSHIIVPAAGGGKALVRILNILLSNLVKGGGATISDEDRVAWVGAAEHRVVNENKEYYERLLGETQRLIDEGGSSEGLDRVKALAMLQLEKLGQYKCLAP